MIAAGKERLVHWFRTAALVGSNLLSGLAIEAACRAKPSNRAAFLHRLLSVFVRRWLYDEATHSGLCSYEPVLSQGAVNLLARRRCDAVDLL